MKFNEISAMALIMLVIFSGCSDQGSSTLSSPDNQLSVNVVLSDSGNVYYSITRNARVVMQRSRLGIVREDQDFSKNLKLLSTSGTEPVSEKYEMLHGKKRDHEYTANRKTWKLENDHGERMEITFQISNDGVAFRYYFPGSSTDLKKITREVTAFTFSDSTTTWIQPRAKAKSGWNASNPSYEEDYLQNKAVTEITPTETGWIFPALFREGDTWMLISETAPDRDYCGSRLLKGAQAAQFVMGFPEASENFPDGPVYPESKTPWQTPWRIIAIGSLANVVESTLGTDLAKPSVVNEASYVKPGRASWSWVSLKDDSIVYDVQKRFIDYAAEMKWEYCLIDVNWDTMIGYDKVKELADYAAGKNVGLILWYNSAGSWNTVPYHPKDRLLTSETRAQEFSRIAEMGIKGIKVDFFGGDGQSMMAYYQDIIEDAAKYKLMVNCHGSTLPRGWQRTYPNLVTMEAVKGFEFVTFTQENADREATHSAMLPFTRNVFDPMDFTPVCFSEIPNIERKTTNAFELALAVLFHSGVQHYAEKPQGMRAVPDYVRELMRTIPVSWEETKLVDGYPGKFVVMARKAKGVWYVAGINGENQDKQVTISLPFISNKNGTLITDGKDRRSFEKTDLVLSQSGEYKVSVNGQGGFLMTFAENQ